ncbi:hypothetical protein F5X97DRAFT_327337 [Nemania serpens]|nr:hypothetical protein F5X97DRAFT_327337 [Nemania serpens]
MPRAQSSSRPLIFVIELAMKIPYAPTAPSYTDRQWKQFLQPIQLAIQGAGIYNCAIKMKQYNDFRTWCITNNLDDRYWFDIVSPKLSYHNRSYWRHQLTQVYAAIASVGTSPSEFWSTTIHIAASPALYQGELKAIAKTVLQHTHGFNALAWDLWGNEVHTTAQYLVNVPPSRRHAKKCLQDIGLAVVPKDIAKVMNPEGDEGGLEYNLASASGTIDDALTWINLACLFVRGALSHNGEWPRGTLKDPDWPMFWETDLSKFVLEQADEMTLSRGEKARLQERLARIGSESNNRGGWGGFQVGR